jgi:hypothetical protein
LLDPEISVNGNWKHSTAVINGFVVDDTWVWEENGIMPVKYLGSPKINRILPRDSSEIYIMSMKFTAVSVPLKI